MAVKFICDGCGKEEQASYTRLGDALKPHAWYQRSDSDGAQHACSRDCVQKIAAESGKTDLVLPF